MRLVLLGAPGTGKGTQGHQLSQAYHLPNISTGDILRDAIEKNTDLGKQAKTYMDRGELVPDNIMIELIKYRLQEQDCNNGFILDGFPRTVSQAKALDAYLSENKKDIQRVIALEVDPKEIVNRLTSRRICRSCGYVYNLISSPPPSDMKCEQCGGEIWQRPDDTEATVRRRLQVYEEKTEPLKAYYQRQQKLNSIDANGSIDEIGLAIRELLSIDDHHKKSS